MKPCCYKTITLLNALANAASHDVTWSHQIVDALRAIPEQCEVCGPVAKGFRKGRRGSYGFGPSALDIHAVKVACVSATAQICGGLH